MENQPKKFSPLVFVALVLVLFVLAVILIPIIILSTVNRATSDMLDPISNANDALKTQVFELQNPTPTIIADPVTVINEVRALARLETIQYSVEKVITAEVGQDQFSFLFGDRILFVAHGEVIAGFDMSKLQAGDLRLQGETLVVRLPQPEIFIASLNNEKSYVYDRDTGFLRNEIVDLETQARQVAEQEILKAAVEDGILDQARTNGEVYLDRLFAALGYTDVVFEYAPADAAPVEVVTPTP